MNPHVLSYVVRDAQDRVVEYADTYGRACRVARRYGPGATVRGAKGQTLYTVPPKLPRDSGNTNVAANGQ